MELPDTEIQPTTGPAAMGAGLPAPTTEPPSGIVLSRDLFFTDKVKGTAAALGYQMREAGDPARARALIAQWRPRLVVLDLTAGEVSAPAALAGYREIAGPATWFVAAGPHVQADALAAAREAGCQVVLPRSKFSAQLPNLLQHYFDQPADLPGPSS